VGFSPPEAETVVTLNDKMNSSPPEPWGLLYVGRKGERKTRAGARLRPAGPKFGRSPHESKYPVKWNLSVRAEERGSRPRGNLWQR